MEERDLHSLSERPLPVTLIPFELKEIFELVEIDYLASDILIIARHDINAGLMGPGQENA